MPFPDFAYWNFRSKVTIDGDRRLILVNPNVTTLSIRADVWSRWVDWRALRGNSAFLNALRRTGLDPVPGGFTGDIYFTINDWRLAVDLTKVRITGVLNSDDSETAYCDYNGKPQYPAVVSQLVQTVVTKEVVVVPAPAPTPEQIVAAFWAHESSRNLLTVPTFLGLQDN